jgi:anhydro-N-acetylmuramic acid kinase
MVARSCAAHVTSHGIAVDEILVSGGGVHNATLMRRLELAMPGIDVASTARIGLDPDFKEAIAFAVLAVLAVLGAPLATGRFTGAAQPVRLGKLVLP